MSHIPEPLDGDYFALESRCRHCQDRIVWRIGTAEWEHFTAPQEGMNYQREMSTTLPVTNGSRALYHGSLTELQGEAHVVGPCICGPCRSDEDRYGYRRYELEVGPDEVVIKHVQRTSFALMADYPSCATLEPVYLS